MVDVLYSSHYICFSLNFAAEYDLCTALGPSLFYSFSTQSLGPRKHEKMDPRYLVFLRSFINRTFLLYLI